MLGYKVTVLKYLRDCLLKEEMYWFRDAPAGRTLTCVLKGQKKNLCPNAGLSFLTMSFQCAEAGMDRLDRTDAA